MADAAPADLTSYIKQNWRKQKKYMRNRSDAIEQKGYFVDCNSCPCKVTRLNPYRTSNPRSFYDSDVEGESLIDGNGTSCSMFNCAPEPLTKAEAEERVKYWQEHGKRAYLKKYVYGDLTPEQEAELEKFYASWNWSLDDPDPNAASGKE